VLAARRRPGGVGSILGASALVALSIPAYTGIDGMLAANHALSLGLVLAGELILLIQALRWSNADASRLSTVILMVIVFQAVLGMWTVIWLVKPVIVMAHLLGGLLTFSLLTWLAWKTTPDVVLVQAEAPRLRRLLWVGLALLAVQIALGGWTSANYAALSCGTHFPMCLGSWWPHADFREGFVLWRGIGVDYEGGVLDGPARVAIQLSHRIVAVLVTGHLLVVLVRMFRTPGLRYWATLLAVLLAAQVTLGILNVRLALPLWTAVAHNAGAALLLFVVVGLLARLRAPE
jgi:cytochrome c oxidase assembly protein subunit 15